MTSPPVRAQRSGEATGRKEARKHLGASPACRLHLRPGTSGKNSRTKTAPHRTSRARPRTPERLVSRGCLECEHFAFAPVGVDSAALTARVGLGSRPERPVRRPLVSKRRPGSPARPEAARPGGRAGPGLRGTQLHRRGPSRGSAEESLNGGPGPQGAWKKSALGGAGCEKGLCVTWARVHVVSGLRGEKARGDALSDVPCCVEQT